MLSSSVRLRFRSEAYSAGGEITCSGLLELLPLNLLLQPAFSLCDVKCQRVFPGSRWWHFAYLISAQWKHTPVHICLSSSEPPPHRKKTEATLCLPHTAGDKSRHRRTPTTISHDISHISCRWAGNRGWQIDWKISPSLIHHSDPRSIAAVLRRKDVCGFPPAREQNQSERKENTQSLSLAIWVFRSHLQTDNLKPEAFYLDLVENQPEQSLQAGRDLSEPQRKIWVCISDKLKRSRTHVLDKLHEWCFCFSLLLQLWCCIEHKIGIRRQTDGLLKLINMRRLRSNCGQASESFH